MSRRRNSSPIELQIML